MTNAIELREAQLYRILMDVFGRERIIPKAKISFVCGGDLPRLPQTRYPRYKRWAEEFRCLFTVVNHHDEPCLVIEFLTDFTDAIDPHEAEREQYLPSVLKLRNIRYMTVNDEEFDALLEPDAEFQFLRLVEEKIGGELGV
jgi:molybdopterin-guanine dinucleotide biosynthesis protein A